MTAKKPSKETRDAKKAAAAERLADSLYADLSFRWCRAAEYQWVKLPVSVPKTERREGEDPGEWHKRLLLELKAGKREGEEMHEWREKLAIQPVGPQKAYLPLKGEGLYVEFANTEPSESGIQKFAAKWGCLLINWQNERAPQAELLEVWRNCIKEMNTVSRVWEACKSENTAVLREHIRWQTKPPVGNNGEPVTWLGTGWIFDIWCWPRDLGNFGEHTIDESDHVGIKDKTDIVGAAKRFLQRWIYNRLEAYGSPANVLWHPKHNRYIIGIKPRTLLGAIWWQFARAFTGGIEVRYCKSARCQKPLEISRDDVGSGFRPNKQFCNNACSQNHHRDRVKKANRLKKDGYTIQEIAKQMYIEPDEVKQLLKAKR